MKISNLRIENFRSIHVLDLDLDDTTVFIGPNNAGKSAVLEALRIGLSRRWGQRGTGFREEDVHRVDDNSDPRASPPVRIQFTFREANVGEWPVDMVSDLDQIAVQTDDGLNQITLSIKYLWNTETEAFQPTWEFLDMAGEPLQGRRRSINASPFFEYLWFFWLGALRDADDEFSSRSRNWGGLLKSAKIPNALEAEIKSALDQLDSKILAADPRFSRIAETLGLATEIAIHDTPGAARLRMLPMDVWDMLSRAGVVLRNDGSRPWLPLTHHGQGLQSLSVIFLLQAAMAQQLLETEYEGAEPIFAIEEPEAHLHPQAARTLWSRVSELSGQKIVTTHSPYFVQNVPLHNLRLIRLTDGLTQCTFLQRRVVSDLPWTTEVGDLVSGKRLSQFVRDTSTGNVAALVCFGDAAAADLTRCWRNDPGFDDFKARVATFQHACRVLVSESDEAALAIFGRRLRGEILFARHWALVEGQSEYLLLHALGEAFNYNLDQHGIAVVDFQNNGSPGIYAALADAFGIPWRMITDGDPAGSNFIEELKNRGFNDGDIAAHVTALPTPRNLEDQLLADGHEALLRSILTEFVRSADTCPLDELRQHLGKRKIPYMTRLASRLVGDAALARTMPAPFVTLVDGLRTRSL
jgi:putative ATP-dependent endonuclease of OLD family